MQHTENALGFLYGLDTWMGCYSGKIRRGAREIAERSELRESIPLHSQHTMIADFPHALFLSKSVFTVSHLTAE